jgi:HD-GYP domain-containing protein (c-di-GMP phosphodiesterase class II)
MTNEENDVSGSLTRRIKEVVAFHLSQLDNEEFRFILFLNLSKKQVFLFNIFETNKGFLDSYKGLHLTKSENFLSILDDNDVFEKHGDIETTYPFLYGDFAKNSSLYAKKIDIGDRYIGVFEFLIKKNYVSQYIKQTLDDLINAIKDLLVDVYMDIRDEMTKRYFVINSLNLIKNARPRTYYHSFRVADLSIEIAKELGINKKSMRNLLHASLIHDLGEMYASRDVFYKEGPLNNDELEIIKQHPANLKNIFANNPLMEDAIDIAYYHHEKIDGSGYYGFKGNDIPIESKILALCEVIDGLYTDRPGRKGFDIKHIMAVIRRSSGIGFDSLVSKAALDVLNKYYIQRDIDFSAFSSISNIGKPAVILIDRDGKLIILQGHIEYIGSGVVGILLLNRLNVNLEPDNMVRVQFSFLDVIYDFIGSVISTTDKTINISLKETLNASEGNLNVFWEFYIVAIPLRLSGKVLNARESKTNLIQMTAKRFGTKSLSAKVKNSDVDLNIGDTVILKMKPLKDEISIPAVISNVIKEGNNITAYFEYFSLSEKMDALIHKAIYYKQAQANAV